MTFPTYFSVEWLARFISFCDLRDCLEQARLGCNLRKSMPWPMTGRLTLSRNQFKKVRAAYIDLFNTPFRFACRLDSLFIVGQSANGTGKFVCIFFFHSSPWSLIVFTVYFWPGVDMFVNTSRADLNSQYTCTFKTYFSGFFINSSFRMITWKINWWENFCCCLLCLSLNLEDEIWVCIPSAGSSSLVHLKIKLLISSGFCSSVDKKGLWLNVPYSIGVASWKKSELLLMFVSFHDMVHANGWRLWSLFLPINEHETSVFKKTRKNIRVVDLWHAQFQLNYRQYNTPWAKKSERPINDKLNEYQSNWKTHQRFKCHQTHHERFISKISNGAELDVIKYNISFIGCLINSTLGNIFAHTLWPFKRNKKTICWEPF